MRLALIFVAALAAAQDHGSHTVAGAALGTVDFPTSCSAGAQEQVTRAVALLHSFAYEESRLTFQAAANADPTCGIALWGVARTWYHPIWPPPLPNEFQQGAAALARARAVGARTPRERDYIDSLAVFYRDAATVDHTTRAKAYEQALARLSQRYPSSWSPSVISTRRIARTPGSAKAARFSTTCCRATPTTPALPTTSFTPPITRPPPSSA
jgi:hypothetical protein